MNDAWQHRRGFAFRGALTLGLAVVLAALTPQRAVSADEPMKLRVLIFSGLNNHDWPSTTPVIKAMFTDCARFGTVDVTENPAGLNAATLARYDVLVSNWTPHPETRRNWPLETEAAFLDFVRKGGGFVVIHAAACTFQVWPSTPAATKAAGIDPNATFEAVARYRYGDERKPLQTLQQLVLYANSLAGNDPQGFRDSLADRMAALLISSDATPAAKVFVCGQLADIASEKQVAALNGLPPTSSLSRRPLCVRSSEFPARRLIECCGRPWGRREAS